MKAREDHRIKSRGLLIATGVNANGNREVLGFAVADSESEDSRCDFLAGLNEELRRRERVIRIFPNDESLIRLMGALLMEHHEIWMTGKKYFTMERYFEERDDTKKVGVNSMCFSPAGRLKTDHCQYRIYTKYTDSIHWRYG